MLSTPQVCVSTLVTISTMLVVDLYLLEQSMMGVRWKAWPWVAVLLGDLCFLLALRFVSAGVASEARSPRRGFANALWFLFLSLLQLKLFFVCQNYRQERRPVDPLARRSLTLLLSVGLPALLLALTGAEQVGPRRRRQEARARLLWAVLDLLDVLDLQAGLWEGHGDTRVPLWAEGLLFFYCYALLLLLPCVSLTELGVAGAQGVYPWLSLVTVNVLTLFVRGAGLLCYRDPRVSTVFLGKNLLALAVRLRSAWEWHRQGAESGGRGGRACCRAGPELADAADPAPSPRCSTLTRSASLSHTRLDASQATLSESCMAPEL